MTHRELRNFQLCKAHYKRHAFLIGSAIATARTGCLSGEVIVYSMIDELWSRSRREHEEPVACVLFKRYIVCVLSSADVFVCV